MAQLELKIGDKTYNKAWVDNLSSTSQISSDPASVNYGVIPSTGNATMRDINGQIRADIESGVLPVSNAPTKVVINGNQIQEHITSDSDYDVINRELNLQFSDRLSLLDKVTYEGMPLRDYSMTAYEMLDDVIGSYGGYCKNEPINWVKYQSGINISTASKSDVITVATGSGWEIIGTPIKVTPNKPHSIQYSIQTQTEYTVGSGQGIAIQILNSAPKNSNCEDIALASAFLGTTAVDNIGTLNFISATDTVYLVVNFGYASDAQTIKVRVNSVRVDEKSLAVATRGLKYIRHSSNGYVDVTTQFIGDFLRSKTLKYPYLPSASYRETIEKFCTLAQITLALDNNGDIFFYDARPCIKNETENEISKSYQIKNLNKTLFLKNKVDGVDIKQSKPTATVEFNVVCLSENITSFPDYTTNENNDYKTATASDGRGVSFKTYYTTFGVKIPKKTDNGLKDIQRVLSGVDNKGNSFIQYTVTWHYQQLVKYSGGEEIVDVGNTETGDIASAIFYSTTGEKISDAMSCTLEYGATASVSCTDKSNIFTPYIFKETKDSNGADFWEATITILVGKEAKHSFVGSTTSVDNEYIGGRFTPLSVDISFYGDVYTVSFEEVDLSTSGIESADNAVSIPTNELMQNASDVKAIRDNILEDYANGIPTADIDLFYDENNKINKGDIICFNDDLSKYGDMNLWRVTGKTLKYNGYPSLSLELQQQKSWHIIDYWNGSIKVDNISNGDFTADTATTKSGTITLPRAFGKNYYFRAIITYMVDDTPYNNDRSGIGSISDSQLLIGTLARIHCNLTISDDGTKVYYSAEEIYKKVGSLHYKGYVKSINIVVFRYTEFD
jgi:hypothetical protein